MRVGFLLLIVLSLTAIQISSCGLWKHKKGGKDAEVPSTDLTPNDPGAVAEPANDGELRLRGYDEVSKVLESAMLSTANRFSLGTYVGGQAGLAPVMGYYNSSNLLTASWTNTVANPVNMGVYILAVSAFAADIATICISDPGRDIHAKPSAEFEKLLKQFCGGGQSKKDLKALWSMLSGRVTPNDEFSYWHTEVEEMKGRPLGDRIEFMVQSAVLSPFVLYRK